MSDNAIGRPMVSEQASEAIHAAVHKAFGYDVSILLIAHEQAYGKTQGGRVVWWHEREGYCVHVWSYSPNESVRLIMGHFGHEHLADAVKDATQAMK